MTECARRLRIPVIATLSALALAACETVGGPQPPPPLPVDGPIAYTCSDGTQLMVDFENNTARVAVIGGVSMVLPNTGTADAPYYSNGRYGLRGRGATASWEVGRRAPAACRGS